MKTLMEIKTNATRRRLGCKKYAKKDTKKDAKIVCPNASKFVSIFGV